MSTEPREPTDDQAPATPQQSPATPAPETPPEAVAPEQPGQAGSAEDAVFEASLESFPGSDAPAWIGSRGTP